MSSDEYVSELKSFPSVHHTAEDIILSSLNTSTGPLEQEDQSKTSIESTREIFLLDSIQTFQDILIRFQKKLKEYESVPGYYSCENIEPFDRQQWKTLIWSDVELQIPILTDMFRKTFQSSSNVLLNMDNTIVRLKAENESINDVLKTNEKLKKKHGLIPSERPKFQTMDLSMTGSVENMEGLLKKMKRQETQIKELKSRINELESELSTAEESKNKCLENNKRLKKEIKNIKEEGESNIIDEINDVKSEIKKLYKDLKPKSEECFGKNNYSKQNSRDLEAKIDSLIESTERRDQENIERTIAEITSVKEEIRQLKKQGCQSLTEDNSQLVEDLQKKISSLEYDLKLKDKEMSDKQSMDMESFDNVVASESCQQFGSKIDSINGSGVGDHKTETKDPAEQIDDDINDSDKTKSEKDDNHEIMELKKIIDQKNTALETIRTKLSASISKVNELQLANDDLLKKNTELVTEVDRCKEEIEKKMRAMEKMKDKIKLSSSSMGSSENVDMYKRKFDQSSSEVVKLKEKISSFEKDHNKKIEECENLKKDKNRLETEINNMKKLNFSKRTENKQ